jgi:hypothetical protein
MNLSCPLKILTPNERWHRQRIKLTHDTCDQLLPIELSRFFNDKPSFIFETNSN